MEGRQEEEQRGKSERRGLMEEEMEQEERKRKMNLGTKEREKVWEVKRRDGRKEG